ncbi:MAG TPA: biotin--[acetyl-CoA-carboxylase] ligase [Deltaproteobacteria bacterium]|nr:biotin--[acetyl-CoA-carboxylase] ligase [Deltaproteobacteria bacterium]
MPLDPLRIGEALSVAPIVLQRTSSTNDALRALALSGAPHGSVVLAEHQEAGRGRQGRSWQSPPGQDLLLSVLVRRPLAAPRVPLLCLAAAVAVAETVAPWIDPGEPGIKWPNDVLAPDGRKLAGILAQAEWERGALAFAVLGIGLNVGSPPPLPTAAALSELTPRALDRSQLAGALIQRVLAQVEDLVGGSGGVLQRWRSHSATLGRRVRIGSIEGRAVSLDDDGALRVIADDGIEHRIRAGDVEMIADLGR